MFYLENNETSEDLVIRCLNKMLLKKYDKFIFYVHNLGGFDVHYILNAILKYNKNVSNLYNYNLIFRDDKT